MTRIAELNKNDVIEYLDYVNGRPLMQLAIVDQVKGKHDFYSNSTKWQAQVEKMNGDKVVIDDNWAFALSKQPFSRKYDCSGETEIKLVNKETGDEFSATMDEIKIDPIGDFYSKLKKDEDETESDTTPAHYQGKFGTDVIEFIEEQLSEDHFKGFMLGNIIKYSTRAGRKDDELEDVKKAKVYCERLIEVLEG